MCVNAMLTSDVDLEIVILVTPVYVSVLVVTRQVAVVAALVVARHVPQDHFIMAHVQQPLVVE